MPKAYLRGLTQREEKQVGVERRALEDWVRLRDAARVAADASGVEADGETGPVGLGVL